MCICIGVRGDVRLRAVLCFHRGACVCFVKECVPHVWSFESGAVRPSFDWFRVHALVFCLKATFVYMV